MKKFDYNLARKRLVLAILVVKLAQVSISCVIDMTVLLGMVS